MTIDCVYFSFFDHFYFLLLRTSFVSRLWSVTVNIYNVSIAMDHLPGFILFCLVFSKMHLFVKLETFCCNKIDPFDLKIINPFWWSISEASQSKNELTNDHTYNGNRFCCFGWPSSIIDWFINRQTQMSFRFCGFKQCIAMQFQYKQTNKYLV